MRQHAESKIPHMHETKLQEDNRKEVSPRRALWQVCTGLDTSTMLALRCVTLCPGGEVPDISQEGFPVSLPFMTSPELREKSQA